MQDTTKNYYIDTWFLSQNLPYYRPETLTSFIFVSKNPEKPKKVCVDLTGHTYDGRCKRLVNDAINVLVFVVLDVCTGL
jgi:hypothetical protein